MLSLVCGNRIPPHPVEALLPPAQLAELLLMKRFRTVDHDSDPALLFDRHDFGTLIDITSES
jgi:hypothetical protein